MQKAIRCSVHKSLLLSLIVSANAHYIGCVWGLGSSGRREAFVIKLANRNDNDDGD